MITPSCNSVERAAAPVVILPTCDKDVQMHMKSLDWMREMDGRLEYDCIVSHDNGMHRILLAEFIAKARAVFANVDIFTYERPGMTGWPWAANWAFQWLAWHMMDKVGRPWFWMEADCVPLKPGWLKTWFDEYAVAMSQNKPIMGSVVEGRGHCNGTAIYPADFPALSPSAMRSTQVAWDWEMRSETIHLTYNSPLMQHAWGMENGKLHPYAGEAVWFQTIEQVRKWVHPHAVLFHRSKDGTLIDRLREMRGTPEEKKVLAHPGGGGGHRMVIR